MSLNLDSALSALRDLAAALGPLVPEPHVGRRVSIDFGVVSVPEYERITGAMRVTLAFDHVNYLGETELDASGVIGAMSVRVRAVRPATDEELLARIDRLRAAVEQRQKDALVAVAMEDMTRGIGGGRGGCRG